MLTAKQTIRFANGNEHFRQSAEVCAELAKIEGKETTVSVLGFSVLKKSKRPDSISEADFNKLPSTLETESEVKAVSDSQIKAFYRLPVFKVKGSLVVKCFPIAEHLNREELNSLLASGSVTAKWMRDEQYKTFKPYIVKEEEN